MPMISTDFHQDTSNWLEGFDGLQIWCIDCRDNSVNQSIQSISIICYVSLKTEKRRPPCCTLPALVLCQENFLRGHGYLDVFSSATPLGLVPWRWIGIEAQQTLCGSAERLPCFYHTGAIWCWLRWSWMSASLTCSWCEDLRPLFLWVPGKWTYEVPHGTWFSTSLVWGSFSGTCLFWAQEFIAVVQV